MHDPDRAALSAHSLGASRVARPQRMELPDERAPAAARIGFVQLGPLQVAQATMESALQFTDALVRDGGRHFFCFCEANLLSSVLRDQDLAGLLRKADAIFADGISLLALARFQGRSLPGRVSGPSFMLAACDYGVQRGWRHFFYGGNPGVAELLTERFKRDHPGIIVAGTYCPPFRPLTSAEEEDVKQRIESAMPDLLWVCLGSPKQERWCAEHLGRLNVPLLLAVGAAFDFHTGHQPWAPKWIRAIGMEWAFRMITGGKRTFLRNMVCVSGIAAYLVKQALKRNRLSADTVPQEPARNPKQAPIHGDVNVPPLHTRSKE